MTATTTLRPPAGAPSRGVRASQPWAGTGTLLRFYLRLDRVRLAVWTLAVGLLVAGSVASLDATYPTAEALQARASLMSNPSAIMMTGPAFGLDDYTFGAMVANELSLYVILATAIMSILLVVRHTRAEEESGRMEVLRALPVGRFAPATAAFLTVAIANLLVGLAIVIGLVGTGLEGESSLALGAGSAVTGLVFGGVAAVAAQLTEHGRTASGMALGALGVAFLIRGIGDVVDNQGSWLSWLSPLAWAQQTRLYVDLRLWPLLVSAAATVVLLTAAIFLAQRRDLGAGIRQGKAGPASASPALLSPAGLARRLLNGSFLAWAIGTFVFAVAFGALADSLEAMIDDIPELAEWISVDLADLTSGFASAMLSFLAIGPVIYPVAAVLRLRSEEEAGRIEAMVVTGSSRPALLGGWLAVVAAQTVVITAGAGLGVGLGVSAVTGEGSWIGQLTLASLAYLPAALLVAAVAVALYGAMPRTAGLSWVLVVWVAGTLFLGELLNLPDWAMDLSPVSHVPAVPNEDLAAAPLIVMGLAAVVIVAVGIAGFRRRDIGVTSS